MTEDFLLELRSEEIPARMQERARTDLAALFEARLKALNLPFERIESFATPRRLALIVRGVAETTSAMTEERKGPRADAPDSAIQGFLRSTGLSREQLVARDDGKGGQVLFAVIERPGVPAGSVLASAASHAIHSFAWPKSMRWGDASISTESLRWVRPLQGIVALLGDKLVPIEVAGLKSGVQTVGHRFHHPGVITIGSANDYVEKLRACHVIVDGAERRAIIAVGAKMAAQKAGLTLVEDEGLLFENAGLTEWPVPLLGRFDADFLSVPPEVIQLTARVNQKYFVCRDAAGKLANAFVCTANVDASDGGAKIVEGNQKVLAARLSDARFFYDTDLKVPLENLTPKLEKIIFHEKLGTVADKVARVRMAAHSLMAHVIAPTDPAGDELCGEVSRAAALSKADLVSGMVGEFPELQGLMGSYYASAQGASANVATAIRDQYKPAGQSDALPEGPVAVALSIADKIDSIASFFVAGMPPSGSRDPFALRRAALGVVRMVITNDLRFSVSALAGNCARSLLSQLVSSERDVHAAAEETRPKVGVSLTAHMNELLARVNVERGGGYLESFDDFHASVRDFFADRLKVQQREAGVRHDLIDAVFALGGEDDLVRLLARVHALQAFVGTEDGKNLLAGYKRAANILKKEDWSASAPAKAGALEVEGQSDPGLRPSPEHGYVPAPEEAELIAALSAAEPKASAAIAREDFEGAMAALATLRAPIDAFFDKVTVNDADPAKRAARLDLLARMRAAVHKVADFSKIEG